MTDNVNNTAYSAFNIVDGDESEGSLMSSSSINGNNMREYRGGKDDGERWQRKWALLLYSFTTILLFADQNLLAPNLSKAAEEFGFDENERDKKLGGDIALAFFVLGAPASFLVGCGADSDSISRSLLFGSTVLIGEGACFITYFTTTYTGLYITRALTGFSVGGALPLLSSILGDWYKPEERGSVMASIGIGTGIGISLGQGISGYIGPIFGWRAPFLVVSLPAMILALLVITTVSDPVRGQSEKFAIDKIILQNEEGNKKGRVAENHHTITLSESPPCSMRKRLSMRTQKKEIPSNIESIDDDHNCHIKENTKSLSCEQFISIFKPSSYTQHISTTKELLSSKTVKLALLQGAPGCIPWGIVNTFLNDYLSEDCGMSVHGATTTVLVFGLGNFFGIIAGGMGGDYLYKKDSRYPSLLSGSMAMLGCIPMWALLNTINIENDEVTLGMMARLGLTAIIAGFACGVTGPIVKATLQNVTLPHERGQAFALLNTFDDFGRGLGPVFVAWMIVGLGGRQVAFNVGVSGWLLCGVFNLFIFFTVKSDVERSRSLFMEKY